MEPKLKYETSDCNKYSNLKDFEELFKKNFWLSPDGKLYIFDKDIRHNEISLQLMGCSVEELMNKSWVRYSVHISEETSESYIRSEQFIPTSKQAEFIRDFDFFYKTSKKHGDEIFGSDQGIDATGINSVRSRMFGIFGQS